MNQTNDVQQDTKPVQLHVIHNMGGGIERWLQDFIHSDDTRTNLLLRPLEGERGKYVGFTLTDGSNDSTPLRVWHFTRALQHTAITHLEYRQAFIELIEQYAVEVIVVSSLIGHSLDILASGLAAVIVHHDYYPYCAAVNITFGTQCYQCSLPRLTRCFWLNPANRVAGSQCAQEWLVLRDAYFTLIRTGQAKLVAPSSSVRDNLIQLDARYREFAWNVIPHGIHTQGYERQIAERQHDMSRKLRILVPGVIVQHKGEELLREIIVNLGDVMDFYLIGSGSAGKYFEQLGVRELVEHFEHAQLPRIVERIAPDLGLLLSTVPETFSYTLSELNALNVPVLATNLGSFSERIEDGKTGFLVQPCGHHIMARLAQLNEDREPLQRVAENLQLDARRDVKAMVADYHRLFDSLAGIATAKQHTEMMRRQLLMLAQVGHLIPIRLASWSWYVLLPFRWFVRKVTNARRKFLR